MGCGSLAIVALACCWLPPAAAAQEGAAAGRYGETPAELVPFHGVGEAYWRFFSEPPQFRGPGRDQPDPDGLEEVRLGVLAPLSGPDQALGERYLAGVQLAVDQANAAGGYRGRLPYAIVLRDENQAWGAAASTAVELRYDSQVWGIVGALSDTHSHVMNRVLLKIELPVVNTSGTDPTLTEHAIPWMVRVRPDDRQNGYALARRIFQEEGRQRVVVFRSNDRYGRVGTSEFVDAARRLHRPIQLELRFQAHQTAWPAELERIRDQRPEAVVIWGPAELAGRVVRALREAGIEAPLYGPDRLVDPLFLRTAGEHAEGMVLTHPFDPAQVAGAWPPFREAYLARDGQEPDAVAAYAFEGTRFLIQAIEEAGLNRPLIRDRMFAAPEPPAAIVPLRFDATFNNTAPVRLGRIEGGVFRLDGG